MHVGRFLGLTKPYGPNQFGIADESWMSHIAFNKLKNQLTVIYGDGKQVCDVLHVNDATRLFLLQAEWRPADQKVFYCDTSKAKDVFGWEPEVDMYKGLFDWTAAAVRAAN